LSTLAKFGIFEAVPRSGDISYSELAVKVPLTDRQLRRVFRQAFTKNIFVESRPDHVAHNSLSLAPVENPSLKAWINHNLGDVMPASSRLPDAIEKFGDPKDPNDTALAIAFNFEKGKGLFDWFKNDGEGDRKGWRAQQFAECMASMDGGGHDKRFTAEAFDWGSLGEGTVVDVSINPDQSS
jgi:6-hydroxytryprostatin B O-methyltransferase